MAKTSVKARQRKRERMVEKDAAKRAELKKAGDWKALDEMAKNGSKVRLKNRCQLTGRQRDMFATLEFPELPCVIWRLMEKYQD
jgi:small subunit ribosomal protein S14